MTRYDAWRLGYDEPDDIECPDCDGWNPEPDCPYCKGTGFVDETELEDARAQDQYDRDHSW